MRIYRLYVYLYVYFAPVGTSRCRKLDICTALHNGWGNIISAGRAVSVYIYKLQRYERMNDFTSFTYAAHLATFLIYVQINAGPDRALEKYNLKGKKKERERGGDLSRDTRVFHGRIYDPCVEESAAWIAWQTCFWKHESGESRLLFRSNCPQKIRLIAAIDRIIFVLNIFIFVMTIPNEFSSLTVFTKKHS